MDGDFAQLEGRDGIVRSGIKVPFEDLKARLQSTVDSGKKLCKPHV